MSAPLVGTAFCCLKRVCRGQYLANTRCVQFLVRRHRSFWMRLQVVSPSILYRGDFRMQCYARSFFSCWCKHIITSKTRISCVLSKSTLCPLLRPALTGVPRKASNSIFPVHFLHTSSVRLAKHSLEYRRRTTTMYVIAIGVLIGGGSYAAVPLYRMFCQATGIGGQAGLLLGEDAVGRKIENLEKISERLITVRFNADTAASMRWAFRPQQTQIKVHPGETALAFYTATNPTDKPVTGISTYNIIPFEAALYFNKIQCFCFEEQLLNPHEQVDMPVFFYIDPDYVHDPKMEHVDTIVLSYTFFEAKEGLELPQPY